MKKLHAHPIFFLLIFYSLFLCEPIQAGSYSTSGAVQGFGEGLRKIGEQMAIDAQREREYQRELQRIQYEQQLERKRIEAENERKRLAAEEERARQEQEKKNATNIGTGFFIDENGFLVTNAHVVEDKSYLAIKNNKNEFYKATIVSIDNNRDLALLEVEGKFPWLNILSSDEVEKGERVFAVGYPQISIQGNESKVTDGVISSFSGIEGNNDLFQISTPIQGGNSGGPLVNENGEVVGVIVATLNASKYFSATGNLPQNVNYAIKSRVLLDFVSGHIAVSGKKTAKKTTIAQVDKATVMVIAKNSPLNLSFTEPAFDKKAEDLKLSAVYPNWKTILQSNRFKEWYAQSTYAKYSLANQKAKFRIEVIDKYNKHVEEQEDILAKKTLDEHREKKEKERLESVVKTEAQIISAYAEWMELKNDEDFNDWLQDKPDLRLAIEKMNDSQQILNAINTYNNETSRRIFTIGKVIDVWPQYSYVVVSLENQAVGNNKRLFFKQNQKNIYVKIGKKSGSNASFLVDRNYIGDIKHGETLYGYK